MTPISRCLVSIAPIPMFRILMAPLPLMCLLRKHIRLRTLGLIGAQEMQSSSWSELYCTAIQEAGPLQILYNRSVETPLLDRGTSSTNSFTNQIIDSS